MTHFLSTNCKGVNVNAKSLLIETLKFEPKTDFFRFFLSVLSRPFQTKRAQLKSTTGRYAKLIVLFDLNDFCAWEKINKDGIVCIQIADVTEREYPQHAHMCVEATVKLHSGGNLWQFVNLTFHSTK